MKKSKNPVKEAHFLRVITPVRTGRYAPECGPVYVYEKAVSYRRSPANKWGDAFWIVPGTLDLHG